MLGWVESAKLNLSSKMGKVARMAKCPVCNTEYTQGQDELCPKCRLPFELYSLLYERDKILAERWITWARGLFHSKLNNFGILTPSYPQTTSPEIQPEFLATITQAVNRQKEIDRRVRHLEELEKERENKQYQIDLERSRMISDVKTEVNRQIDKERANLHFQISQLEEQLRKEKQERSHFQSHISNLAAEFTPRLSNLETQLDQDRKERSHFPSQISQLQQNVSQTFSNYETWCQNTNQSINSLTTKVGEIQTNVAQLQEYSRNNQRLNSVTQINAPTPTSRSTTPIESSQVNVSQALSLDESNLVSKYNNNPNIFTNKIEVSETKESNDNRRGGSNQSPILETSRRANYWIISESGFYYLVPSPNLKLNEFNYKTVEAFFKCHNYGENSSRNVRLFKPAQVSALPGGEKWELIQPGVIQFE
ncbi:hypothetical protein [Merismopedia glauca]|uniref:Uncharacterized protein n=1 Tax=Merismopedia glauca CCAP 1448/3 TaxID=1296344 RepID=A0A2T1C7P4_9CYAN|nr:hypothetical protein [Merismopedia glauca]PSB04280.1 hypothetical protein C7B64_04785 [Merismopedia glauca CCAP 1448/3]